jgi:hypothetical protein
MESNLKTIACSEKETRALLDKNNKIIYVYNDKVGKLITRILINKVDCK